MLHKRRRPACPITSPHTDDADWIPAVAGAGWVTITRDRHIQDHGAEVAAVRENRLRMVALSAPEARTTWEQLEVVMCQWRAIEALADREAPVALSGDPYITPIDLSAVAVPSRIRPCNG